MKHRLNTDFIRHGRTIGTNSILLQDQGTRLVVSLPDLDELLVATRSVLSLQEQRLIGTLAYNGRSHYRSQRSDRAHSLERSI